MTGGGPAMKHLRALVQIAALSAAYFGCDRLAHALGSPVPGGVLGAVTLATLLLSGALPLRWVEDGADLLLRHLGLFFVPAAVASLRQPLSVRELVGLAVVSAVTTVLVMVVTGLVARAAEPR